MVPGGELFGVSKRVKQPHSPIGKRAAGCPPALSRHVPLFMFMKKICDPSRPGVNDKQMAKRQPTKTRSASTKDSQLKKSSEWSLQKRIQEQGYRSLAEAWNLYKHQYEVHFERPMDEPEHAEFKKFRSVHARLTIPLPPKFSQKCSIYSNYVTDLKSKSHFDLLANLAGLKVEPRVRQRSHIHPYGKLSLPDDPFMSTKELEVLCGGPDIMGARLLYWCAVAENPRLYGYPPDFRADLGHRMFWYRTDAAGISQFNESLLKCMCDAQEQIWSLFKATSSCSQAFIRQNSSKFNRLTRLHQKVLCLLLDSPNWSIGFSDFDRELGPGKVTGTRSMVSEDTRKSRIRRCNHDLESVDLPYTLSTKNRHVVLECDTPG